MAQLESLFDATSYYDPEPPKLTSFEVLPKGKYLAAITESEVKDTKDSTGRYIKLKFTILEGTFKDKNVWTMLHVRNKNQDFAAKEIKQFARLCVAAGKNKVADTSVLHSVPLYIDVIEQKGKDKEGKERMQNDIFDFTPKKGTKPVDVRAQVVTFEDETETTEATSPF